MATPKQDPGPFSSLFDYKEEQKKLDERKKQQEDSQKKIMRTNALGEAFRLLVDAVGGSQGASILPRPVNPAIFQASEKLQGYDKDYRSQSENLRLQDLRTKELDLQHGLGLEAEGRQKAYEGQKLADQRAWEGEKLDQANKQQLERDKLNAGYAKDLENTRSKNDLGQIQERYKGELDKITTKSQEDLKKVGALQVARYDDPNQTEPLNRDTIIGMFKDLKQYLSDKGVYPTMHPAILQTKDQGNISNDDLRKLVAEYPEFFAPRFPQLTGGAPLPQQQQLTPLEKRKQRYDEELEKIIINLNLSPRERARKIKALQKNNKDIIEMEPATEEYIPTGAEVFKDGKQDFSEFMKTWQLQNQ